MKKTPTIRIGTAFSGIGSFEQALEILNIPHEIVFACDNGGIMLEDIASEKEMNSISMESDPLKKLQLVEDIYLKTKRRTNFVKQAYLSNYDLDPTNFYHDVRYLGSHIEKEIDVFVGGSPCQSFSTAGARGGFEDTRGTLFFEFARNVKEFQPKVFIYENVKGLLHHDQGRTFATVLNTFEELGYKFHYQILTPKDFGIPQSRQRIFVIGFKDHEIGSNFNFPKPIDLQFKMGDFLIGAVDAKRTGLKPDFLRNKKRLGNETGINTTNVEAKFFPSDRLVATLMKTESRSGSMKFNPTINTDIAKALTATMHKMHRASMDNYVTTEGKFRKLTPRECLRLMGFPDTFKQSVSDLQTYKQAGNSIVVDVLMAIIKQIVATDVFKK
jgi:DNA (cytosine-5)-methyltransferase 1